MAKWVGDDGQHNQYLEMMDNPEEAMAEIFEDAIDWSQQDDNYKLQPKTKRRSHYSLWCLNFNGHSRGDGEIAAWFDDSLSKVSVGTVSDSMMQEKYNQVSKLWKRWPLKKAELVASETRLVLPKRIVELADGEKRIYASRRAIKAQ